MANSGLKSGVERVVMEIIQKWVRKIREHSERKRVREYRLVKHKVGASYSVWDGEELLEFAIRSIRSEVDYINVVWQRLSWYGNPCSPELESHLLGLKAKGLIDELLFFEPDLTLSPNLNETSKRNIGLEAARRAGCTHFLTLDTDEFFEEKEFREAVDYIVKNGITHSACNQILYIDVHHRESLPADWFAPFVYRIDQGQSFVCNVFGGRPWLIDPSKEIPITPQSTVCFMGKVRMHHFSGVRKNLDRKIENSSALQNPQMAQLHKERMHAERRVLAEKVIAGDYVRVENRFGIHL